MQITDEEILFYSTIPRNNQVFTEAKGILTEDKLHLCVILQIRVLKNNDVRYFLKYHPNEMGRKRAPFWIENWKVNRFPANAMQPTQRTQAVNDSTGLTVSRIRGAGAQAHLRAKDREEAQQRRVIVVLRANINGR